MLTIDEIIIKNFLSVGAVPQTIALNFAPLTLVLGENLDVDGEESRNGSGKTTMVQAISYGLFGAPLTNIKLDNLINSINEKEMMVTIKFNNEGVPYRIERGRKPNILRFFVGAEQTDCALGENRQTQIAIERALGLSHTMFVLIVALNTFSIPFLKMRPIDQREVIEELLGITLISELASRLKDIIDDETKKTVRDQESLVKAITEANSRIEGAIKQASDEAIRWDRQQHMLLTELGGKLESLDVVDIDAELTVFDRIDAWLMRKRAQDELTNQINRDIETAEKDVRRLRFDLQRYEREAADEGTAEAASLQSQSKRLRTEAERSIQSEVDRLRAQAERHRAMTNWNCDAFQQADAELASLQSQLANPDAHHCVTCGQGLSGTDHLMAVQAALEEQIRMIIDRKDQLRENAEVSDCAAADTDDQITRLIETRQQQTVQLLTQADALDIEAEIVIKKLMERRLELLAKINSLTKEISVLEATQVGFQERLAQVDVMEPMPRSSYASRDALWKLRQDRERLLSQLEIELERENPYQGKVAALTSTLSEIDYTILNDAIVQLKHEQFLYKLLTAKDSFIRKRIIDQNLNFLNRRLNAYLEDLGLPHEVCFMPDLGVEIHLQGREFDFEQLSRGEQNRVVLSVSWAFRDVWESLNNGINLVFCDEVLDQGTDGAGVEAAVVVLSRMARERSKNIFLISHRETLKSQIDRVLIAQKLDQFTSYHEVTGY